MKFLIFFVFSTLVLAQNSGSTIEKNTYNDFAGIDPAGIITIGDNSYYTSPENIEVSYIEALRFCNDGGMKLISFETEEKWLEVSEYLGNGTDYDFTSLWTSGIEISEIWQWSGTGQEFEYTAWNIEEDEPTSFYIENCVYFTALEGWFDDDCKFTKAFMCEI